MRRREFLYLFGSAAASWPLAAGAQQLPVIGFLASPSAGPIAYLVAAFRKGLEDAGYAEGRNVSIEHRYADSQLDRLPALAADLVQRRVSVIVAAGGGLTARIAKAATATIPIVFVHGEDPVKTGLVSSLGRPGGNLTGVTFFTIELGPKRLELLRELVSGARRIALLVNPKSANAESEVSATAAEKAIRASGQQPVLVHAASEAEFEPAFASLKQQQADALLTISDPLFTSGRNQLVALAARHAVPAIYPLREFADAGGFVSYGASSVEAFRQVGAYVARILKGAKPADLPVVQPSRFELVINLKTARAIGLTITREFLLRADEVIE